MESYLIACMVKSTPNRLLRNQCKLVKYIRVGNEHMTKTNKFSLFKSIAILIVFIKQFTLYTLLISF